ncbi:MAG: trypsin-like serine protease [Planctomycetaceae bacterium]
MRIPRALVASAILAGLSASSWAGVIRDDRSDSVYTGMAQNPAFAASGRLVISGTGTGSATLIAPDWILTAGHCAITEHGPNTSQTFVISTPNGLVSHPIRVEEVYVHSGWITGGFSLQSGYDLALMKLQTPVVGVKPAVLETSANSIGKVFTTVGFGTTGTGRTGSTGAVGTLRAGQNVFDATQASIRLGSVSRLDVGSPRTRLYDVDSPRGDRSTLGAPTARHLEYTAAPGDSGGAAFVQSGSSFRIAGVVSGGIRPLALLDGHYGTTGIYIRVSQHASWIESTLRGGGEPLPSMLRRLEIEGGGMAARVRERSVRLAAAGWTEARYIAPLVIEADSQHPHFPVVFQHNHGLSPEAAAVFGAFDPEVR